MDTKTEYNYDIFISYAEADHAWVQGYFLRALGLRAESTITRHNFRPGASLVAEFERAVTGSRYTVLVLSPAYLADEWSSLGEHLASHLTIDQQQERVIPLLLQPCDVPLRINFRVGLDCTNQNNQESEVTRLRVLLNQPEPVLEKIECPYPGMVPFSANDARFFYGREAKIDKMLQLLRHQRYLFVIGPSGSGKSSLISAGFLPKLHESTFFPRGYWLVRTIRPGSQPMEMLSQVVGADLTQPTQVIAALLAAHPPAQRLLLIIDPLEEIFTQASQAEQSKFITALQALCKIEFCALVIALRGDFFYTDLIGRDLWSIAPAERLEVVPLRGAALRDAIVKPAAHYGVYLDAGLVERLLADAAEEPGVLPLVQETMVLLWDKMERRLISLHAYEQLSSDGRTGLAVAIATKADATLNQLSSKQQAIARRIFLRLVQFGEGRADVRRQQSVAALRTVGDDPLLIEQILRHLTDNRLLTLSVEEKGDRQVDIAHEVLISGWRTLRDWITERREAEQVRRRLEAKVIEWVRLGRQGGLLDEIELREAEHWLASPDAAELGYGESLLALVQASRTAIEEAEQAKKEAAQRELQAAQKLAETERKARVRQRNFSVGLGILSLIAGIVATLAIYQTIEVSNQNRINTARRLSSEAALIADTQYDRALLLAVQGVNFDANREVQSNLSTVLQEKPQLLTYLHGHTDTILDAVFSPDGRLLASAGADHSVVLWDIETNHPFGTPLHLHTKTVVSLAFSPDGRMLASGGADREIILWDINTRKPIGIPLAPHPNSVIDLAFNADSSLLAAISDQSLFLWDVQAHKRIMEEPLAGKADVQSLALSPDGSLLAESFTNGEIIFWSIDTRLQLGKPLKGSQTAITQLAFSPDGRILAGWDSDNLVHFWDVKTRLSVGELELGNAGQHYGGAFSPDGRQTLSSRCIQTLTRGMCPSSEIIVWDIKTGQPLTRFTGHSAQVTRVAFHPDGKRIVSASADATIILWDLTRRPFLANSFTGHTLTVNDLAFHPSGKTLASASSDGTIQLRDVEGEKSAVALKVLEKGNVMSVEFSPNGLLLASGDTDGVLRFWDGITYAPLVEPLEKHETPVESIAFSPDGSLLASGNRDGQIFLWDTQTRETIGKPLAGHTDLVKSLAFSPDSKLLVSASIGKKGVRGVGEGGQVLIWDVRTHEKIGEMRDPQNGSAYSLAFSPNGKHFVLGFADGRLQIVDGNTHQISRQWQAHVGAIASLAFNRDGTQLVSGSLDQTVNLWDTQSWQPIVSFVGHTGEVRAVVFSPTGDYVASGGAIDWVVRLWNVSLVRWQAEACAIANRNLTRDEYVQYVNPDLTEYDRLYMNNPTCKDLPVDLNSTLTN